MEKEGGGGGVPGQTAIRASQKQLLAGCDGMDAKWIPTKCGMHERGARRPPAVGRSPQMQAAERLCTAEGCWHSSSGAPAGNSPLRVLQGAREWGRHVQMQTSC